MSKDCYIRPYNLSGNDDDKFKVLNMLAETDFKSCERINYSEQINTVYSDGQVAKGYIDLSSINSHFDSESEYFALQAEKQLPVLIKFEGDGKGKNETTKQTLPQSPLFVKTIIFENEYGDMKPFTTAENKTWLGFERIRLGVEN